MLKGHGHYEAMGLESEHAELITRGLGTSELWVKDGLMLDAQEFSAVRYRGEPELLSNPRPDNS